MTTTSPPRSGRLGLSLLIPAITLLFFGVDMALRSVPLDGFAFRAWEPLSEKPAPGAPFRANARFDSDTAYGDLAAMGNRPDLRRLRREVFTTDAQGFRNPPDLLGAGPPEVVLFGDSFGVGSGVSDDETLSAELARITGRRVYSAAGSGLSTYHIRKVLDRLHMTKGIVVCEFLERRGGAAAPGAEAPVAPPVPSGIHLRFVERHLRVSRLRILSEAFHKRLQDDVLLPNPGRGALWMGALPDGTAIPFFVPEVLTPAAGAVDEENARLLLSIARDIATPDLRVVFVLVPSKFTVYGPLAEPPGSLGLQHAPERLDLVERGLRNGGAEVLNVTEALKRAAVEGLATGRHVYLLDDTHWNAAGIALAAQRVAELLAKPR